MPDVIYRFNVLLLGLVILHHHVIFSWFVVLIALGTGTHVLRRDVYVQYVLLVRRTLALWSELIWRYSIDCQLWRGLAKLLWHEALHLLWIERAWRDAETLWQQLLRCTHRHQWVVMLQQSSLLQ